jgi:hypothetical protein
MKPQQFAAICFWLTRDTFRADRVLRDFGQPKRYKELPNDQPNKH